jgi:uncharacterized protein YdhG (YjbR/CyaY superfamily)
MRSSAADVARYIAEQLKEWQPALNQLRITRRRKLRGYTESMVFGMPSYERRGQVEVGFGKQARYLSLYNIKLPVFEAHRAELGGAQPWKGLHQVSTARSDRLGSRLQSPGGYPRQYRRRLLSPAVPYCAPPPIVICHPPIVICHPPIAICCLGARRLPDHWCLRAAARGERDLSALSLSRSRPRSPTWPRSSGRRGPSASGLRRRPRKPAL